MRQPPEFNSADFGFSPDDTNTAEHSSHAKTANLLISLYQDKEANAGEREQALYYLKTCAQCRQTLESYRRISTELQAYFETVPSPPPLPRLAQMTNHRVSRNGNLPYAQGSRATQNRNRLAPFALQLGMVAVTLLLIIGILALVVNSSREPQIGATAVGVVTPVNSPAPTTQIISTPTPTVTALPTATTAPTVAPTETAFGYTIIPSATPTPTPSEQTSVAIPTTGQTPGSAPTTAPVVSNTPIPSTATATVAPVPTNTAVPPTPTPVVNTPTAQPPTPTPVATVDAISPVAPLTTTATATVAVAASVTPTTPPTVAPTNTAVPTVTPTIAPTNPPTITPFPPTATATVVPPTVAPTNTPTTAVATVAAGQIAYISKENGEIYLIKSDGTGKTPLTAVGNAMRWQSLVWSNNGRTLAAVGVDAKTNVSGIFLIEPGKPTEFVTEGFAPVWSPNDRFLAYLAQPRANSSGKPTIVEVSTNAIKGLSEDYSNLAPQWFDDNFRVLVGQSKIYDTSGKLISQFDVFENSCAAASLSPGGNLLAVLEANGDTFTPLIYDLDTPVVRNKPTQSLDKITIRGNVGQGNRCGSYRIRWLSNSQSFYFYHREAGRFETCLVGIKDSTLRCLANLYEPSFNSANTALVDIDPATGNMFAIPFGNRPANYTNIAVARDLPQWQPPVR
jgi:anti-sigma factor RsiW